MGDDSSDEDIETLDKEDSEGPLLLRGPTKPLRVEDVLQAMPPKRLTDRIIQAYFDAKDHSAGKCHHHHLAQSNAN